MSACIIPAGPEFQDPPGGPNSPPFLWMASPDEGTTVVSEMPTFSVTPGDFNVDDPIFVKWIVEFPPFVPNPGGTIDLRPDELPPSADGTPIRAPKTFSPNCNQVNNASTHHITAAISDRPFVDLLTTTSEVPPILVSWTWEHSCPQ